MASGSESAVEPTPLTTLADLVLAKGLTLGRPNPEGWQAAKCPFHDDKTESLSVNVSLGRSGAFRCHAAGCGAKGDAVSWLVHDGLTVAEALRRVQPHGWQTSPHHASKEMSQEILWEGPDGARVQHRIDFEPARRDPKTGKVEAKRIYWAREPKIPPGRLVHFPASTGPIGIGGANKPEASGKAEAPEAAEADDLLVWCEGAKAAAAVARAGVRAAAFPAASTVPDAETLAWAAANRTRAQAGRWLLWPDKEPGGVQATNLLSRRACELPADLRPAAGLAFVLPPERLGKGEDAADCTLAEIREAIASAHCPSPPAKQRPPGPGSDTSDASAASDAQPDRPPTPDEIGEHKRLLMTAFAGGADLIWDRNRPGCFAYRAPTGPEAGYWVRGEAADDAVMRRIHLWMETPAERAGGGLPGPKQSHARQVGLYRKIQTAPAVRSVDGHEFFDADFSRIRTPEGIWLPGAVGADAPVIRPPAADDYLTLSTRAAPRMLPDSRSVLWQEFLVPQCGGEEAAAYFLECYSLWLDRNPERSVIWLHGRGSTGKGTWNEFVRYAAGDLAFVWPHALNTEPLHRADRIELLRIHNRRACFDDEANNLSSLATQNTKRLTGGDAFETRRHHSNEMLTIRPRFVLYRASNEPPPMAADSALARRLTVLPMRRELVDGGDAPPDPGFKRRLRAPECMADLLYRLDRAAARRWRENGGRLSRPPAAIEAATKAFLLESQSIHEWAEECLAPGGPDGQPNDWTALSAILASYRAWCERSGQRPLGPKRFAQQLRERGRIQRPAAGAGKDAGYAERRAPMRGHTEFLLTLIQTAHSGAAFSASAASAASAGGREPGDDDVPF